MEAGAGSMPRFLFYFRKQPMTDNNIIPMPIPLAKLAQQLRDDVAATIAIHAQWVESMLQLGVHLREARERFPSDNAFGHWLIDENIGLSDNDRACLIKMASEPEVFRGVLIEQTDALHADTLYRKYSNRFGKLPKPTPPPTLPAEQAPIASPEPEKVDSAKSEPPQSSPTLSPPPRPRDTLPKTGKASPLRTLPNADLVYAHIRNHKGRSNLAEIVKHKKTRGFWNLLIESIELGIFGEPYDDEVANPVRILVPALPSRALPRLDLLNPSNYWIVRELLFPLLLEKPDLKVAPHLLEKELENRRRAREEQARQQDQLAKHKQQVVPGNEQRIVAYGEPLWPPIGDLGPRFSYKELCHACWYARYFLGIARKDWRPLEVAMAARHLTKYLEPLLPGFVAAVRAIFNAYEANPEGETIFPITPVNFGY
jgi:hypothetical protein